MSSLLHVEVSPSGSSVSKSIAQDYLAAWSAAHPGGEVAHRDISGNVVPHLDIEAIMAVRTPVAEHTPSMNAKYEYRKELIAELLGADEILISSPMWNWSIPSALKAYFDQVIMSGALDASMNRGLAGKKVTFIVAHGGSYAPGAPKASWDFETGYLKLVANALGATDVQLIAAEFTLAGISPAMSDFVDAKAASIEAARQTARSRAA